MIRRVVILPKIRSFSDAAAPARRKVSPEERVALRAARKERATQFLQAQGQSPSTSASSSNTSLRFSRWMWYAGVGIPSGLIAWGIGDADSPPGKFSEAIGFSAMVQELIDPLAKPSHEKLLPDWSQVSAKGQLESFSWLPTNLFVRSLDSKRAQKYSRPAYVGA